MDMIGIFWRAMTRKLYFIVWLGLAMHLFQSHTIWYNSLIVTYHNVPISSIPFGFIRSSDFHVNILLIGLRNYMHCLSYSTIFGFCCDLSKSLILVEFSLGKLNCSCQVMKILLRQYWFFFHISKEKYHSQFLLSFQLVDFRWKCIYTYCYWLTCIPLSTL